MKKIFLFIVAMLFLFACNKNKTTPVPVNAAVTITFQNKINGQPVENGKYKYTNAAGNLYTVSLLKYYVSNAILTNDENVEVKLNNYDLIDAFNTGSFSTIEGKAIPNGTYKSLRFNVGIDSIRNHTGAQDGDLDPMHNMIWTWNTGYLFLKHEGKFINAIGDTTNLQYHLGTDLAYTAVSIPINMVVNGTAKNLKIDFDLNKMYDSPVIDFNSGNIRHSTAIGDKGWISSMVINAQDAFTFAGVN